MAVKAKKVAVVGDGISGVSAAAHLLRQGIETVLFERSNIAGGVWHYDERSVLESSYPNTKPSAGDYITKPEGTDSISLLQLTNDQDFELGHAPPGPSYAGLKNNVSTRMMKTSLQEWPLGTEDYVTQGVIEEYVQALSNDNGVTPITQYNTRVEAISKQGSHWVIRSTALQRSPKSSHLREKYWTFDAVVVASGHYNTPKIPAWPGVAQWKAARPAQVWHSKGYRKPQQFKDKNVLIIGAGVSANDIAKEASPYAKRIYQSARQGALDLPASFLPRNATRVAGIKSFNLDTSRVNEATGADSSIPGTVTLEDGLIIGDIHTVVVATGYLLSYPFLRQFHDDDLSAEDASGSVLVTAEGEMIHNLHKDIFYIPDPTLSFIGAPFHIATFSLFDIQAEIVARVLSGKAALPTEQEMRAEYRKKKEKKGLGRDFHSLRGEGEEIGYALDLVSWANEDAAKLGHGDKMVGHTPEWHKANTDRAEQFKWVLGQREGREEPPPEIAKALLNVFTKVAA